VALPAFDHLDLVVSDLERGLEFYGAVLAPLGFDRRSEIVGEQGERVVYMSRTGERGAISLRESHDGREQRPFDRYDLGIHHICWSAPSREVVDEVFDAAKGAGAEVEDEPREYDYTPGYYAAFFRDPDGIKLEVLHRP
jgi:catechol 2,3-dioxygenase-like lactoylglutathione lyase family enzyme